MFHVKHVCDVPEMGFSQDHIKFLLIVCEKHGPSPRLAGRRPRRAGRATPAAGPGRRPDPAGPRPGALSASPGAAGREL